MKQLVDEKSELLRTRVEDFVWVENPERDPKEIVEELIEAADHYGGYSLSANQLDGFSNFRLLVYGSKDNWNEMFNPEILQSSEKLQYSKEGCVNFPFLIHSVYRPKTIKVRYQLYTGEEKIEEFSGFTARVISHSIDLLNGIVFTEVVSKSERTRGRIKRKINRKRALRKQRSIAKLYREANFTLPDNINADEEISLMPDDLKEN